MVYQCQLICSCMRSPSNYFFRLCRFSIVSLLFLFRLIVLSTEGVNPKHMYMAFLTQDKVGLQILPFDGNPHQSTALIAHPGGVSHKNLNGSFNYIINTPDCRKSTQIWLNPTLKKKTLIPYISGPLLHLNQMRTERKLLNSITLRS